MDKCGKCGVMKRYDGRLWYIYLDVHTALWVCKECWVDHVKMYPFYPQTREDVYHRLAHGDNQ